MKYSIYILALIATVVFSATILAEDHGYDRGNSEQATWPSARDEGPLQALAAGSRLPDCSHACGSCSPCKLVISSACASLAQAETCPVSYRCMCNNKYYPVP